VGELRWILLGLGLIALAAIYGYSRFRVRRSADSATTDRQRVEPSLGRTSPNAEPEAPGDEPEVIVAEPAPPAKVPEKVVAIRLMSKDKSGFPGDKLVLAMRRAGLRHGRFGIFHALKGDTDSIVFSVANLVEPGTFDLAALTNTRLPGVSLFLVLPGPEDTMQSLDTMIDTARALAAALDGELLDEQGSSLSVQRERYIRDEIQQFIREHLTPVAATGSAE
jgi:cell division protein ZipA